MKRGLWAALQDPAFLLAAHFSSAPLAGLLSAAALLYHLIPLPAALVLLLQLNTVDLKQTSFTNPGLLVLAAVPPSMAVLYTVWAGGPRYQGRPVPLPRELALGSWQDCSGLPLPGGRSVWGTFLPCVVA